MKKHGTRILAGMGVLLLAQMPSERTAFAQPDCQSDPSIPACQHDCKSGTIWNEQKKKCMPMHGGHGPAPHSAPPAAGSSGGWTDDPSSGSPDDDSVQGGNNSSSVNLKWKVDWDKDASANNLLVNVTDGCRSPAGIFMAGAQAAHCCQNGGSGSSGSGDGSGSSGSSDDCPGALNEVEADLLAMGVINQKTGDGLTQSISNLMGNSNPLGGGQPGGSTTGSGGGDPGSSSSTPPGGQGGGGGVIGAATAGGTTNGAPGVVAGRAGLDKKTPGGQDSKSGKFGAGAGGPLFGGTPGAGAASAGGTAGAATAGDANGKGTAGDAGAGGAQYAGGGGGGGGGGGQVENTVDTGNLQWGLAQGAGSGAQAQGEKTMGSDDPEDYFSRLSKFDNLFRKVEMKYKEKTPALQDKN